MNCRFRLPKYNLSRHVTYAQNRLIPCRCYSSNPYQILGLQQGTSKKEVKAAYVKLSKKYHPDINKESGANEKFLEIKEAAELLLTKGSQSSAAGAQGQRQGSRHGGQGYEDVFHQRRVWQEMRRRENTRRMEEDIRRHASKHQSFWQDYYRNQQRVSDEEFWRQFYKERDEWYGGTRRHFNAEEKREQWSKYYEKSKQKRQEHERERSERIRQTMEDHQNRRRGNMGQESSKRSQRSTRSETFDDDPFGYDENPFKTIREEFNQHVQMEQKISASYVKKFFLGFFGVQLLIAVILSIGATYKDYNRRGGWGVRPGVIKYENQDSTRESRDENRDFQRQLILGTYSKLSPAKQTKSMDENSLKSSEESSTSQKINS